MPLDENLITFMPDFELAANTSRPEDISFDGVFTPEKKRHGEGAIVIGHVADHTAFSSFNARFHSEPHAVKSAGSLLHRIPKRFEQFLPAISMMAAYEAQYSNLFLYKEGFLTVRQWCVKEGACQNNMGWHVDERPKRQMMTGRFPLVNHIYIVTDSNPSLVQKKPLRYAFNELSGGNPGAAGTYRQMNPYDIALMTNFCYHRSAPAKDTGIRTFLRVIYESPKKSILENLPDERKNELRLKL